jgi:hypothetical protein
LPLPPPTHRDQEGEVGDHGETENHEGSFNAFDRAAWRSFLDLGRPSGGCLVDERKRTGPPFKGHLLGFQGTLSKPYLACGGLRVLKYNGALAVLRCIYGRGQNLPI